jgi:hypothetical protein
LKDDIQFQILYLQEVPRLAPPLDTSSSTGPSRNLSVQRPPWSGEAATTSGSATASQSSKVRLKPLPFSSSIQGTACSKFSFSFLFSCLLETCLQI